jgi:stage V sporulation protein B
LRIPEAELTLVALSPAVFFVSVSSIVRGYFNGRQNMKPTANSQTLEQVFKTFLTILFVEMVFILSGANTELMAAGATIATALATFLSFGYLYIYYKIMRKQIWTELRGSVQYRPERIKTIIKGILMVSIPISLTALLSTLNKNIDSFTVVRGLSNFITDPERAKELYGILSGKVDTLTSLPLSFNVAFSISLVPAVSSLFAKKNFESATKRISFTILSTILLALPCTIGMIIFAEPILHLIYPNQPEGTLPLQITSLTIITIALVQTINAALQGIGKIIVPAIALSIGVLAKLICNIVLVPIEGIGINGAAIGSVVCYVIADIIALVVLCKNIKLNFNFSKFVIKPVLATLAMSIVSYGLYINMVGIISPKIATVTALAVAVAVYGVSIIMLKVFTNDEIEMFPYGNKINKFLKKHTKKEGF